MILFDDDRQRAEAMVREAGGGKLSDDQVKALAKGLCDTVERTTSPEWTARASGAP